MCAVIPFEACDPSDLCAMIEAGQYLSPDDAGIGSWADIQHYENCYADSKTQRISKSIHRKHLEWLPKDAWMPTNTHKENRWPVDFDRMTLYEQMQVINSYTTRNI